MKRKISCIVAFLQDFPDLVKRSNQRMCRPKDECLALKGFAACTELLQAHYHDGRRCICGDNQIQHAHLIAKAFRTCAHSEPLGAQICAWRAGRQAHNCPGRHCVHHDKRAYSGCASDSSGQALRLGHHEHLHAGAAGKELTERYVFRSSLPCCCLVVSKSQRRVLPNPAGFSRDQGSTRDAYGAVLIYGCSAQTRIPPCSAHRLLQADHH